MLNKKTDTKEDMSYDSIHSKVQNHMEQATMLEVRLVVSQLGGPRKRDLCAEVWGESSGG